MFAAVQPCPQAWTARHLQRALRTETALRIESMKALKQIVGVALVAVFLFGSGSGVEWLGLPATLAVALCGAYLGVSLLGSQGPVSG